VKNDPSRDKVYLGLVAELPCIITGIFGVHVHHIKEDWYCMGRKSPDYHAIPLVPYKHQNSNEAFHVMGAKRWRLENGSEINLARKTQELIIDLHGYEIPEEYRLYE